MTPDSNVPVAHALRSIREKAHRRHIGYLRVHPNDHFALAAMREDERPDSHVLHNRLDGSQFVHAGPQEVLVIRDPRTPEGKPTWTEAQI